MDLGYERIVIGVVTQGRQDQWSWVTQFRVTVSEDAVSWTNVDGARIFNANTNYRGTVENKFDQPVLARYVRVHPVAWSGYLAMRAAVVLETQCVIQHFRTKCTLQSDAVCRACDTRGCPPGTVQTAECGANNDI
eukprot:1610744-Rhodomonas_salina.1